MAFFFIHFSGADLVAMKHLPGNAQVWFCGGHMPWSLPADTLDVDTLVCGVWKGPPPEVCPQPVVLASAASRTNKKRAWNTSRSCYVNGQGELSKWLVIWKCNPNPGDPNPKFGTLNRDKSLTEWLFSLGLKAKCKLWRLGSTEVCVIQFQSLLYESPARFNSSNFARKTRSLGNETNLP